ncbi:hypothetical protein GQ53DRAFT_120380 [Neofusicoccum parvum]|nr:hypothetical protein GQ53DRAFT_120380 [Neofusicoccum parvum]
MQDYGEHSQRDVRQFQASVSWLVLYYPLNPYFVIFCNVITTSDADDLALLRGVTDNLNVFVTNRRRGSPAIEGVRRLFHAFVQLCVPRVDCDREAPISAASGQDAPAPAPQRRVAGQDGRSRPHNPARRRNATHAFPRPGATHRADLGPRSQAESCATPRGVAAQSSFVHDILPPAYITQPPQTPQAARMTSRPHAAPETAAGADAAGAVQAGRSLDALEEQELVRCLRDSQPSLQWLEPDQLSGFTL